MDTQNTLSRITQNTAPDGNRQANGIKRVAVYCRVSTLSEAQEESYETQCAAYKKMISNDPKLELVRIYGDQGISGATMKHRPEFQQMLEDCRNGKIDVVMTKSISRFARNLADCMEAIRQLRELGIPVLFEREGIDTMTTNGEMLLSVLASIAQEEINNMSQNIRWSQERNNAAGNPIIGARYGYKKIKDGNRHRWVINEDEAKRVQFAFQKADIGWKYWQILDGLDELEKRAGTAVKWTYPLFVVGDVDYIVMVGLMLVISISGVSEFFVVGRCRSLLYSHQKVYISSIVQAVSIFISLVCAVILLKLKCGIIVVQLAVSAVYVFRAVGLAFYVWKAYPEYRNYKKYKPIKKAVEKKNDALIHQITGLVATGSQSIILSTIVGLEAASIFAVYNIVFSGLFSICSNFNTAVTPFFGKTIAVGNTGKLKKQFNLSEFFFFNIAALVFAVSAVMIIPFVSLYTKNADINYIDPLFSLFFVIFTTCNVLRLPGQAIINASGHFKETRWRAIIEATSCLLLSIIFTCFFGKIGVLMGTSISIAWRCVDIIVYANIKVIKQPNKRSLFRLVRTFSVIFIVWFLFSRINITPNNYFQWIYYALIVALITMLVILISIAMFERYAIKYIFKSLKKNRTTFKT